MENIILNLPTQYRTDIEVVLVSSFEKRILGLSDYELLQIYSELCLQAKTEEEKGTDKNEI